jgi:hypothetical protein
MYEAESTSFVDYAYGTKEMFFYVYKGINKNCFL